jgi:hypothetical protein
LHLLHSRDKTWMSQAQMWATARGCYSDWATHHQGVGSAAGCETDPEADIVGGSTLSSVSASSLALFVIPASFWPEFSTATASFGSEFSIVCSYVD